MEPNYRKKQKIVISINKLTDTELGICEEALHHGVNQLHDIMKDLKHLPANLSAPEALLMLTLLSEMPLEARAKVKGLMDQLRATALAPPVDDGGTILHFPPP